MADDIVGLEIGITIPFVIICVLSFCIRVYARKYIVNSFGADDWMMVAAFFVWIGQQYITYAWVYYGAGKHMSEVPAHDIVMMKRYLFAEEYLYLGLQLLIKLSFLLFYLRFLGKTRWRKAIHATMILVCVQVGGTWIFYGLQCIPIQAYFTPGKYPNAKCFTTGTAYYAPSAVNVLVDVVIYVLPIKPLASLEASLNRRIRLITIMTLGGCTILVSTLRFIVLYQLATSADFTYIFGHVVIVTTIEFVCGMFTANMPAISTAYKYHFRGACPDDHEMGRLTSNVPPSAGIEANRRGSSRLGAALRRTGPGAIPVTRNKASISAGSAIRRETGFCVSPTDSEDDLVKCPGVVVTSKWEVSAEDARARLARRDTSKSPVSLKLRDDV